MGVLGIVPFLLKKCPQVIENIPNRFQALEGKTIAIDGTLITQRLHFTPDPRPYRHVLGWYQLIEELRQNRINVICVFDGKNRVAAKQNEVERRRLLRVQAQARGAWEKSRHKRLRSLTQALRKLETLPEDHQKEILAGLRIDPQSSPLVGEHRAEGLSIAGLAESPQSKMNALASPSSEPTIEDASTLDELRAIDQSEQPGDLQSSGANTTSPTLKEPPTASKRTRRKKSSRMEPSEAGESSGIAQPLGELISLDKLSLQKHPAAREVELDTGAAISLSRHVIEKNLKVGKATDSPKSALSSKDLGLSESDAAATRPPTAPLTSLGTKADAVLDANITSDYVENINVLDPRASLDRLSPRWANQLKSDLLPNDDNKALIHKILDLYDHYNRTTTSGPDGTIHALAKGSIIQEAQVVPISRVQLKYTQDEANLWKEIVASSDNATMNVNIARFVEMVEQFASEELPSDEALPGQEEGVTTISERSARLEEQSNFMVASFTRRANPPTALTFAESRLILEAMGVPCIESSLPYEAEALASSLVLNGFADFVGSEDTDVLMYNAPLLRNMTNRKVSLQIIPPSVETGLGLSRAAFVDLAILMGTDFAQRVKKIGPNTAWRLMRTHGSIERMLEEESKFRPPDVADYLEQVKVARMIFNSIPPAPSAESISQGHWNEQAIYDVMLRFGLQRYLEDDQVLPDALASNYYNE